MARRHFPRCSTLVCGRVLVVVGFRKHFLPISNVFERNYLISLRWPPIDLRRGVHLKHQNLISKFEKIEKKICRVPDYFTLCLPDSILKVNIVAVTTILVLHVGNGRYEHVWLDIMFLAITVQFFFKVFNIIKSSSDAWDGLPGADRWGVIEAKLSNSFQTTNIFKIPKPP